MGGASGALVYLAPCALMLAGWFGCGGAERPDPGNGAAQTGQPAVGSASESIGSSFESATDEVDSARPDTVVANCEDVSVTTEELWADHMRQLYTGVSAMVAECEVAPQLQICRELPGPPDEFTNWAAWLSQQPPYPPEIPCMSILFPAGDRGALGEIGFHPEKARSQIHFEERDGGLTIVQTLRESCDSPEVTRYELDVHMDDYGLARGEFARRCVPER